MNLKFLKKKKEFKKGGGGIKPDFFWKYILFSTFVLILGFSTFGVYFFIKINEELTLKEVNIENQETIKKERIEKVLEYFSKREEKSIEILNSPSPVVDPSL